MVGELGGSALFGARFRENAGRALLIPRAYPGRRTPLWQQRLKSQTLLEVAKRYAQFPIVLETYRECLRDVLDLPGLQRPAAQAALARARAGRGRDADRLAVRLLAAVRLRRDLHVRGRHAQRRAPRGRAGARPRAAARAARPGGAARADRPGRAGARSRPTCSGCPSARAPTRVDALHDVLRRVGDLTRDEARAARAAAPTRTLARRSSAASAARSCCASAASERWVAAEDAGLYRDALGAVPPVRPARGVPRRRAGRDGAARAPLRAHARPVRDARAARALRRSTSRRCWSALERAGELVRGELRPGGTQREWCDPEVLRRLRRASLAALRKEIEPADQRALARFLPSWQGVDRHPPAGAGHRPPARGARRRCRASRCRSRCGSATCCRAASAPTRPSWLDQLCAAGEVVWVGAGALGRRSRPRRAVLPRGRAAARPAAARRGEPPSRARRTTRSASACAPAPASSPTCWPTSPASRPRSCRRRCGTSCGRAR